MRAFPYAGLRFIKSLCGATVVIRRRIFLTEIAMNVAQKIVERAARVRKIFLAQIAATLREESRLIAQCASRAMHGIDGRRNKT